MMLDWNILLLLAWMYFWHISFVSTWRPWWICIRASPKRRSCDIVLRRPVRFDPLESTEGSLFICTPNWQCAANAQELLDIWKLIFISMLKTSQKAVRATLFRSLLPVGNPLLQLCKIAVGIGRSSSQNFMQLRCYILQTWLPLQKVDWDQAESKLI